MEEKSIVVVKRLYHDYDNEGEAYSEIWGVFDSYEDWKSVEKEVKLVAICYTEIDERDDNDGWLHDECMGYLKNGLEKIENEYARAWYQYQIENNDLVTVSNKFCSLYKYQQDMKKYGFSKGQSFDSNTVYYLTLDTSSKKNDDDGESAKKRQRVEE